LLEELRALIPGAQVLFGLLLTVLAPVLVQAAPAAAFFLFVAWRWRAVALVRIVRERAASRLLLCALLLARPTVLPSRHAQACRHHVDR
jgi:hypothetical protein